MVSGFWTGVQFPSSPPKIKKLWGGKMTGLYKITNRLNNKTYIGKTTQLDFIWNKHKDLNETKNLKIEKEMALYGIDKFEFSVLEECREEELDEKEKYYMQMYDSVENGYNANGGLNEVPTIVLKRKRRVSPNVGIGLRKHTERMKTDPEYREMMVQKYKKNRPNAISVDMLDKDTMEIIMTFPKIMDGAAWIRENTSYSKADYATINKICKGQGRTAYGYKWRYTKDR